jgi:hypothetical protein
MSKTFDKQLEVKTLGAVSSETSPPVEQPGVAVPVLMAGNFKLMIHVTEIEHGSPPEPIMVGIESDSTPDFDDQPVFISAIPIPGPGVFEIALSQRMFEQVDPDAAAVRVSTTFDSGLVQSITYGAFLAPQA